MTVQKGWKMLVLAAGLLGMVTGCIPSQNELRLERDLAEMKRRLATVERDLSAQRSAVPDDRLLQMGRSQADLQAGVDGLRVELQSVGGRFEDMTRQQRELHDDLSMVREDLGLKVSAIEARIDRLEKRSSSQSLNAETLSPQGDSPAALYEQGLDLIQKKSAFAEGRKLLQDFLKRYPKDALAVNAQYWVGESYYGEKKYEDAILQFQEVIQQYGDHPKVAAALLKQGLAFKALGDDKNSRLILQKVVDTFPLSAEAKKARERLAEGRGK